MGRSPRLLYHGSTHRPVDTGRIVALILTATLAAGACGAPRDRASEPSRGPAPPIASTTDPPPVAAAPVVARPSTCTAPFTVAPPYPDPWVDAAAAAPGFEMGAWPTRPMRGPFAARDEAQADCADLARTAAQPFADIVHCATGDGTRPPGPENMAVHVLLVRTARGWWAHELAREQWPHRDPRGADVQLAHVTRLLAADRLGDGGAEVSAITEVGPPGGDRTRHVFVCGLGPSGVPACADLRVAAGGPFHGPGALLYALTLACDGTLTLAGWEGGTPVELVHGRATLAFR